MIAIEGSHRERRASPGGFLSRLICRTIGHQWSRRVADAAGATRFCWRCDRVEARTTAPDDPKGLWLEVPADNLEPRPPHEIPPARIMAAAEKLRHPLPVPEVGRWPRQEPQQLGRLQTELESVRAALKVVARRADDAEAERDQLLAAANGKPYHANAAAIRRAAETRHQLEEITSDRDRLADVSGRRLETIRALESQLTVARRELAALGAADELLDLLAPFQPDSAQWHDRGDELVVPWPAPTT